MSWKEAFMAYLKVLSQHSPGEAEGGSIRKAGIKRIVFLDFIHHLVSQEQTKLRKLKIIDKRTQYTCPQTNHTRINY
jgi:hypothetical protein